MEANGKSKRVRVVTKPYEKHKTEKKVVVKHKLKDPFQLSKAVFDVEFESFRLYIEVRANRQTTNFPSKLFLTVTKSNYENCMNIPAVKMVLEKEKEEILASISAFMGLKGDNFNIYEWHRHYKYVIDRDISLFTKVSRTFSEALANNLVTFGVEAKIYYELCKSNDDYSKLDKSILLASIISKLNVTGFDKFINTHIIFMRDIWTKLRINEEIFFIDGALNNNYMKANFDLFFRKSHLQSGFFKKVVIEFLKINSDDPAYTSLLGYEKILLNQDAEDFEYLQVMGLDRR